MPVGAGIVVGGVAVGLLALILGGGARRKAYVDLVIEIPSSPDDIAMVDQLLCKCIDAQGKNKTRNCLCAAQLLHPEPENLWPPVSGDHPSIRATWEVIGARWDEVAAMSDEERQEYCFALEQPNGPTVFKKPPTGPVPFVFHTAMDPGYPWEQPTIHRGGDGVHYPTPSTFFDLGAENREPGIDTLIEVARGMVGSAQAMAGLPVDVTSELTMQAVLLIICSPWNDEISGQTNAALAGGGLGIGPHGRGPNMNPVHADNLTRLATGQSAKRTIRLTGQRLPADRRDNVPASEQLQMWLPAINLQLLAQGIVSVEGMQWSDGSTTLNPPPEVWRRGVDPSGVQPPGGSWGCPLPQREMFFPGG